MSFLKIRETIDKYYSNVDVTDPLEEEKIELFKDTDACLVLEVMFEGNLLEKNTENYCILCTYICTNIYLSIELLKGILAVSKFCQ